MSDLGYIDKTLEVKIAGQDATGNGVNYVSADINGNMLVKDYSDGPVTPGAVASASALIGGQFNTVLPTLTTGQQSAIQLDSSGRYIISPLTNTSVVKSQLEDNAGNGLTSTAISAKQALDVNIAQTNSDRSTTGTISALNGTIAINTSGSSSVVVTVTGTWVATLTFQGFDGTNWIVASALTLPAGGITEALSANGSVLLNCGGFAQVRIIATAYTSGTANIFINAGAGISLVEVYNDSQNPLITKAELQDNSANGITSTAINSKQRLDVDLAAEGITGSAVPFDTIQIGGSDGTDLRTILTDTSGRIRVAGSSYFHPLFTARVQAVSAVTTVLSTSLTATISATKAGNTIIVAACCNAGTLTITDSATQSYSTATTLPGNGTKISKIFYFPNTAAGVTTITISSTSSTDLNMVVTEYSGILTASPLDQTSTNGATTVSTWTSNATPVTSQASELLIGICMGTVHANSVFTPATTWGSIDTVLNTRGGANLELFMADQNTVATGTYAFTGAITGNPNDDLYASIATFKFATPNMIVATNSAITIKSGAGILRKVALNTIGTGLASVTFYDNTTASGTIIANMSLTSAIGTMLYDLYFTTGLTMVINSATPDFTVIYD